VTCGEIEPLLNAYHDEELDPSRSLEVEGHLRQCAGCSASLERLKAVSAVVAQARYHSAPEGLRRRLAARPSVSRRYGAWVALAAACLIGVVVFLAPWRTAPAGVEREIVSAHVRSLLANHLLDVPSSDQHTVKPWFAGKLDFAPEVAAPAGFDLLGGRLDYIQGRVVAALIYRRRQHTVNVFVWPEAGGDESPRSETIEGFHLIHWALAGMNRWAVSDLSATELQELAR